nr:nucleotidyl transferase AbiEii/AbiGii toxin family protein [uncultured Roseateles sp.]
MAASSVMIEKDFWVCWLLGLLFADPELAPHLVFKGGTSLSKVYGVIDRFSEDIYLSMSPAFVGADEAAFEALNSRTRRDAALAHMQIQCSERTQAFLMPRLEAAIAEHLGFRGDGASWLRYEDDPVARSPVVHLEYPSAEKNGFEYLRREVKLELGSLTDQRPTEQHSVRAWVVDDFPAAFPDWQCNVTALELSRTFWEKATILHADHHRPQDQTTPDRYARHCADMARLLEQPNAQAMLSDHALCARVVEWKSRVFARQWARYDLAIPGTFRLLPTDTRRIALARDYAQMSAMFLTAPPAFDAVLAQLGAAEQQFNEIKHTDSGRGGDMV